MLRYNIAGISMEIISDDLNSLDIFSPFTSFFKDSASLKVNVSCCDNICIAEGKLFINEGFPWLQKEDESRIVAISFCEPRS